MTPALSRRMAAALHRLPDGTLTLAERGKLIKQSQKCNTLDELPKWIRDLVLEGEKT